MKKLLISILFVSSMQAAPFPSTGTLASSVGGTALMLYCLRESGRANQMRPRERQRLLATAVSAVFSLAYARAKVQQQGASKLLGLNLLLANRAVFDFLIAKGGRYRVDQVLCQLERYSMYGLYMTQVAMHSPASLAGLEVLYQGLVRGPLLYTKPVALAAHVAYRVRNYFEM